MNQDPGPITADAMMRDLAEGLRDVINEVPVADLEKDPEAAFLDMACRLVFQVRAKVTVMPTREVTRANARVGQAEAAQRIFDIFTRWMLEHPECFYETQIGSSGKFEITVLAPPNPGALGEVKAFFTGETIQDCYAQAAQTIEFGGGHL